MDKEEQHETDAYNNKAKDVELITQKNEMNAISEQENIENAAVKKNILSGATAKKHVYIMVLSFLCLFLIWSYFAKFQNIAIARGEMVPISNVEFVQHLEGGMIDKYFVSHGDIVHKGDLIATLKDYSRETTNTISRKRLAIEYLSKERLHALLTDTKPKFTHLTKDKDIINAQRRLYYGLIADQIQERKYYDKLIKNKRAVLYSMHDRLKSAKTQLGLVNQQVVMREKLYKQQGASKIELNNAKIQRINMQREIQSLDENILMANDVIDETYLQKQQAISTRKVEYNIQYKEIQAQIIELVEMRKVYKDKKSRLNVLSPVYGVIRDLPIDSSSAVIEGGGVIAEIIPLKEGLKSEIRIQPKDIGFVSIGQKVSMKFDTFDFSRFGSIAGVVSQIDTGTFTDPQTKEVYYLGEVTLKKQYVNSMGNKYSLLPGMEMTADIKIGQTRAIDFIIKPIAHALNEAFREK
ncbi:MAG: HlyD family type I secretion periplasmic adaptor subunit [Psychromonas sp.]|nr:HlyD family type I secretion periplasmic adaptor subunit [Psychromonas sp.]